jgi:hypothetical protein
MQLFCKNSKFTAMESTPTYLQGHLVSNADRYEVRNAPVQGFSVAKKALETEEIERLGLPEEANPGKYYKVKMAGSAIDRHRERFTEEVLVKYAQDIEREGASFNFGHDNRNLIGKVMKATVENGDLMGYVWVDELAMMPNQPKMSVLHAIEAGIVKDVSVEVSGNLRVVTKNDQGMATEWEFYYDPNRPEATEFHGLALVQRGAQRGAALSVKAAATEVEIAEKENLIISNMKEVFVIEGKKHFISAKVEGSEIVAEGLIEVEAAIAELESKAAKSVELEGELTAKSGEIAALRAPFEADILNGQKALGTEEPMSEDAIKSLSAAELVAKAAKVAEQLSKQGENVVVNSKPTKLPWQA